MSLLEQEQPLPHGGVTHERRLIRIPDRRSHIISQSSLSEKGWCIAYFSFSLSYSATYDWNFCESASFFSFWLKKWHNGSFYGETSLWRLNERASWAGRLTSRPPAESYPLNASIYLAPPPQRKGSLTTRGCGIRSCCWSGSRSGRFSCSFSRSLDRHSSFFDFDNVCDTTLLQKKGQTPKSAIISQRRRSRRDRNCKALIPSWRGSRIGKEFFEAGSKGTLSFGRQVAYRVSFG